jgi:hypothetical protein
MAKAKAKHELYVDEQNGFTLFKPATPLLFEPAEGTPAADAPVLTVASKKGDLELAVLLGPPLSPQLQQVMTEKLAANVAGTLPDGYASKKARRFDRPDQRSCYQVPFTGKKHQGLVVSVAGGKKTFLLVSTFPAGLRSAAVTDLMFVQLSLMVKKPPAAVRKR